MILPLQFDGLSIATIVDLWSINFLELTAQVKQMFNPVWL